MYELECSECGTKNRSASKEGTCRACGIGFEIIWPAEYAAVENPKGWKGEKL